VTAASPARSGDDGDAAAAIVEKAAKEATHGRVAADAIVRTKEALERATRLRAVGDEPHARAAEGLAREWAETARDLVRAADAEAAATDVRRKAVDAEAGLERARALVEDGIGRVGRLRAELDEAGRAGAKDRAAVERHDVATAPGKKDASKGRPDGAAQGGTP
jgi:hypothetical protein